MGTKPVEGVIHLGVVETTLVGRQEVEHWYDIPEVRTDRIRQN